MRVARGKTARDLHLATTAMEKCLGPLPSTEGFSGKSSLRFQLAAARGFADCLSENTVDVEFNETVLLSPGEVGTGKQKRNEPMQRRPRTLR